MAKIREIGNSKMSLMDKAVAAKEAKQRTEEDGIKREIYQNPVPLGPWWIKRKEKP